MLFQNILQTPNGSIYCLLISGYAPGKLGIHLMKDKEGKWGEGEKF